MPRFAERLRILREEKELSQMELSKQLGISKSSINMYERGEREPSFETMEAIADFFNVDMDYLYGKSDYKNKHSWLISIDGGHTIAETSQKTPATDDDIKFALFGGKGEITDAMYAEVRSFADYVRQREEKKANDPILIHPRRFDHSYQKLASPVILSAIEKKDDKKKDTD